MFNPDSTRWCLCLYEAPMPGPRQIAVTLSPYRRPTLETAPVDAKAACLYPNNARALFEAASRGFDNCLLTDMLGNVAELANSNVFMVKDGVVLTPAPNGTFLDGITRQRTIQLLRAAGEAVVETSLRYADFQGARSSPAATSPSSRPSPGSTSASCSPARCSARRASSTRRSRRQVACSQLLSPPPKNRHRRASVVQTGDMVDTCSETSLTECSETSLTG